MTDTPKPAPRQPGTAMGPGCDEFSGGGGSATDTRDRALPGHREGDCDPIAEAPARDAPKR